MTAIGYNARTAQFRLLRDEYIQDIQQPITGGSMINNYLLPPVISEKELEYIKNRGAYIDNILKSIDLSKLDIQIPVLNKTLLKQPTIKNIYKS